MWNPKHVLKTNFQECTIMLMFISQLSACNKSGEKKANKIFHFLKDF